MTGFAQGGTKFRVTGKVIEQDTKLPLEYTTVTLTNVARPSAVAGGITDNKGGFGFDVPAGTYNIKIEFISFKPYMLQGKVIDQNLDLGTIALAPDVTQLQEVEVRNERTTVDIKLDKKVYNVGSDLMVKGGTVSDVLDNVPSVSVDSDGTVSLRGNANVRILIDGRPSNAINIAEALRQIPADAIDKVEVVTNPSARYDSEGGGGLLNIILKKGKNLGVNGTVIANAGHPESYGGSASINYRAKEFNIFTNTGYNDRTNKGRSMNDTEYLNADGTPRNYVDERRRNTQNSRNFNTNLGMDWLMDDRTTWTNSVNYRKSDSENPERVTYYNFDENRENRVVTNRNNFQRSDDLDVEFATNFIHKFKKDGHKLTVDGAFSTNKDDDNSIIENNSGTFLRESTTSIQRQNRNTIQSDYVLPIGKDSQFEAGYKGDFNRLTTDYQVGELLGDGSVTLYPEFTNILEYKEKINALYTQFGSKMGKFSYLLGLRWEDSNIEINQLTTDDYNTKKYSNFFPSAFLTYSFDDETNISLSYSRRISRPRGRQINPFSNYSSNINIFRGNPDLDPAFTDAVDLGFLKRWGQLTLSTSAYLNKTTDAFQFVRQPTGEFVTTSILDGEDIYDEDGNLEQVIGRPDIRAEVILTSPINLATEYRFGFEFTLNYTPYKWWKLNSNFNFFRNETQGDFTYVDFQGDTVTQDFDNVAYSWYTRLTSKITLPYKIDWQTNLNYNGPQTNAQGRRLGNFNMNLGFSKDVLKDKGTIAFNVQDVFNSRKWISETNLPGLNSKSEMQWRVRSFNLSFTYRFNKQKNERERERQPRNNEEGGGEFPG